ncbi:hypothetical protein [Bacillus cereus]|uniref:hypothetical protein n=1 Tax=Bacillus cereus TaxID=1396 RepID=UPI00330E1733|nr:hypothetical protein [Bacillus cereus]
MYSMNPYYTQNFAVSGAYSRSNDVTNPIAKSRRYEILSKVSRLNLSQIIQSIPIPELGGTTALTAYYNFLLLVTGDLLIKMAIYPELEEVKTVRGFTNTKLITGAVANEIEGPHIFTITDGELLKINLETLQVVDKNSDLDWENARFLDGAGPNLYTVIGDELINIDVETLRKKGSDSGWQDANLLAVPGDAKIYISRNGELFRLKEVTFEYEDSTRDWAGATFLAGSGRFIYLIEDGNLIRIEGWNFSTNPTVPPAPGWRNATLMTAENEIYIVEDESSSFKNSEQAYRSYADYNHYHCQYVLQSVPYYYRSHYYPYYPCYLYY